MTPNNISQDKKTAPFIFRPTMISIILNPILTLILMLFFTYVSITMMVSHFTIGGMVIFAIFFIFILVWTKRTLKFSLFTSFNNGTLTTRTLLTNHSFDLNNLISIERVTEDSGRAGQSYYLKLTGRDSKNIYLDLRDLSSISRASLFALLEPYFNRPEVKKPKEYKSILSMYVGSSDDGLPEDTFKTN